MIFTVLLFLQTMAVPVYSPPAPPRPKPDPAMLSLVVADTDTQTDPHKLCPADDCTALYLSRYRNAVTLAGVPMPERFELREGMGSPYNKRYRLVMIVLHKPDGATEIVGGRGFNTSTHVACFDQLQTAPIGWHPEGKGIVYDHGRLCVPEQSAMFGK